MGNWFSSASCTDILLDEILQEFEAKRDLFTQKGADINSSITYLKRTDVRKQFSEICTQINAEKVTARFGAILGLAFIEIDVVTSDGKTFVLNFWPCSHCACIGVQEKKKAA